MKRNQYLRRGLTLAGFEGGWLDDPFAETPESPAP
jgi:hypothetical protein